MNPSALQILRAALEEIAKGPDTFGPRWAMTQARAALEAAAKAPSLADDPRLARAVATEISKARNGHLQQWRNTDLAAAALDAIDAYQRGGEKP